MAITTDISKLPRGVRKVRHGYKARIEIADREITLGTYVTPQDAELAYRGAKALREALLVERSVWKETSSEPAKRWELTAKGRSTA